MSIFEVKGVGAADHTPPGNPLDDLIRVMMYLYATVTFFGTTDDMLTLPGWNGENRDGKRHI